MDPRVVESVDELWRSLESMPVAAELARLKDSPTEYPFFFSEYPVFVSLPEGLLRGQIDLLAECDGIWEVIDFKTTRDEKTRKATHAEHRIQMLCYLLYLRRHAPEQSECTARIIYPALGREETVRIAAEEFDAVERKIGDFMRRFKDERGRLWPVFSEKKCRGCLFEKLPICRSLAPR